MKRWIWINTSFQATHQWAECPHNDVAFLRDCHHHMFFVKVSTTVEHNDRDIEFLRFKKLVDDSIDNLYGTDRIKELGRKSCEDIAEELYNKLIQTDSNLAYRKFDIEVSEDNLVGARLNF